MSLMDAISRLPLTHVCLMCRGGRHDLCGGPGAVRGGFLLPTCTCPDPTHPTPQGS